MSQRRELLRQSAAATALAALGLPLTRCTSRQEGTAAAVGDVAWTKGVWRFCGTGCGVMVGTRENRVMASRAPPRAR